MEKNGLNEVFQSAYKTKHSTETALRRLFKEGVCHPKDDITRALDKYHAAFLSILDLSAAFDTIDNVILFHQFEHDFGIKVTALQWFKPYMTGRNFRVCISGEMSERFTLEYGLPKGSIIGLRGFTKYAQHVATIIRRHGYMFYIYADDIQVHDTFDPKIPGEAASIIFKLSCCAAEIRNWITQNKVKLNEYVYCLTTPHNAWSFWNHNMHWNH
ncbi:hypothetical protein BSL78_10364 [Apostichopus japonicus]|uniref:Reverse transcriptase domain-containing protein n=1 Tax=Stichopus japonicus TaxID=307972 RepID=A0A2G8KXM1_STIJA|nr:hypothetical protein BSL78_10364 [Apostichopus japonicus]